MSRKEELIERLRRCVIPVRYSTYPLRWYQKLSYQQLIAMSETIVVDGPKFEDYDFENKQISSPYKYDSEIGEYVIVTDGGTVEIVTD